MLLGGLSEWKLGRLTVMALHGDCFVLTGIYFMGRCASLVACLEHEDTSTSSKMSFLE